MLWVIVLVVGKLPVQAEESGYIREQHTVDVGGSVETWQLVWDGKPSNVCGPDEVFEAITCPCSGFAYGQAGKLVLFRKHDGRDIESMNLGRYFVNEDNPGWNDAPGRSYLRRWPIRVSDLRREDDGDKRLVSEIEQRPASTIMQLADYNRDGWPTKFLLEVGTEPCGK